MQFIRHTVVLSVLVFFNISFVSSKTNLLSLLSNSGEGYIYQYPKECSDALRAFAQSASNFTLCSILHARPIRLCEKCIDEYGLFKKEYADLLNTVVDGRSCQSLFMFHDRLEVILEYYNNILSVWEKGNCNDCFHWGKDIPEIANKTKKFNLMFNETMTCIISNMNFSNNSDIVCEKCMQSYLQLDEFYKTLSKDSMGLESLCMDIVDSMNTTRFIWSKSLNCCKIRQSPEIIFLCCTGIISFLPLLFYLAVAYCGPIRDLPNVLNQSRFKQIILRSENVHERIN